MKGNAVLRIVVYSLGILLLLGVLLGVLDTNFYLEDGRIHSYAHDAPDPAEAARHVNQQEISTEIQNIEIEWVAGSVTIHPSGSLNYISVTESSIDGTGHEMVCRQSGQTLKIQFSEETIKFPSFGIEVDVSKDLVITVPKNWNCNNLEIDAAATEVNIYDMTIHELDFDGASGNLILDNCSIENLDIDTASGDVTFSGDLEKLDFDAASAKFYGEFFESPRSIKMDTMTGDLELVLPSDSGFELKLDTMSGSFDTDFTFGKHENLYICGDGSCKINVSALSGDVSILKGIA